MLVQYVYKMKTKIITIILVLGMVLSSSTTAFAQVAPNIPGLKSPLDQFKSGIKIQDIRCQPAFTLVIKSENSHPACVKESTAQRLVSLNWGTILQTQNKQVVLEENPSSANNNFAFAFFSKIPDRNKVNIFFSPYSISEAFSRHTRVLRETLQNSYSQSLGSSKMTPHEKTISSHKTSS